MRYPVALLLLVASYQPIQSLDEDLSVPFAHDFNTSLHEWNVGKKVWHWTGNSKTIPNTKNIPFAIESNYIWSQKSCFVSENATNQLLYSQFVTNVPNNTKFHFKYWLHTNDDADCGFLSFSLLSFSLLNNASDIVTKTITQNSSNGWDDVTIDCQLDNCCNDYNCDLILFISGSVGCKGAEDLIMIRSVSATVSEQEIQLNHTTEMPESNDIPKYRSSSGTAITSNGSATTSRGSVEVSGTLNKSNCRLDLQRQLEAMHSALDQLLLRNENREFERLIEQIVESHMETERPQELAEKSEGSLIEYDRANIIDLSHINFIDRSTSKDFEERFGNKHDQLKLLEKNEMPTTEKPGESVKNAKFWSILSENFGLIWTIGGIAILCLLILGTKEIVARYKKVKSRTADDRDQLITNESATDQSNLA